MSINPTAADIMTERLCASMKREEHLQQRLTAADERADTATSLIQRIVANFDTEIEFHEDVEPNDLEHDQVLAEMREFLSPKDTEWRMHPCKNGHRDVGAAGGVAHCYTCDEKITAANTQEAFKQWNATHPATERRIPIGVHPYSTRKTCNPSPFKVSRYSGKDSALAGKKFA